MASISQIPSATTVRVLPEIVQTAVSALLKVTGSPELAVAERVAVEALALIEGVKLIVLLRAVTLVERVALTAGR